MYKYIYIYTCAYASTHRPWAFHKPPSAADAFHVSFGVKGCWTWTTGCDYTSYAKGVHFQLVRARVLCGILVMSTLHLLTGPMTTHTYNIYIKILGVSVWMSLCQQKIKQTFTLYVEFGFFFLPPSQKKQEKRNKWPIICHNLSRDKNATKKNPTKQGNRKWACRAPRDVACAASRAFWLAERATCACGKQNPRCVYMRTRGNGRQRCRPRVQDVFFAVCLQAPDPVIANTSPLGRTVVISWWALARRGWPALGDASACYRDANRKAKLVGYAKTLTSGRVYFLEQESFGAAGLTLLSSC